MYAAVLVLSADEWTKDDVLTAIVFSLVVFDGPLLIIIVPTAIHHIVRHTCDTSYSIHTVCVIVPLQTTQSVFFLPQPFVALRLLI